MYPIAETEAGLTAILRSLLKGRVSGDVLARIQLQAQAASVRLRREASDLRNQSKILSAGGVGNAAAETAFAPAC